ncbi:MAG: DUF192 domain-containing protein [Burkholderiaceae bacterium]
MHAPPLMLYRATSFWARLRGLHAHSALSGHRGLWLFPCNAIQTFGLVAEIDVIFLDARGRVLKRVDCLAPNRIAFCLSAKSVVELPRGYCARYPHYLAAIYRSLRWVDPAAYSTVG